MLCTASASGWEPSGQDARVPAVPGEWRPRSVLARTSSAAAAPSPEPSDSAAAAAEEPPTASARLLCPWAGSVVAAIVACQGEQELVPWCARVAAASLPERVRGEAPLCEQAWAHNASLLMALQALTRALPRGWTPLRRAERAAAGLAAEVLRRLDAEGGEATLVARLVVAFALYGFSVEPGGGRVCC